MAETARGAPIADGEDPFILFSSWLGEASRSETEDPNAMCLATATKSGSPSARMVLLKQHDPLGFVFYTNLRSRKAEEIGLNPFAALLFHWKTLRRQIRIEGRVQVVAPDEADRYFASRDRLSKLGAHASDQSHLLKSHSDLTDRLAEFGRLYPDEDIPRPNHWSGYRVVPARFEFWVDKPHRLHHRTIFVRDDEVEAQWRISHLNP